MHRRVVSCYGLTGYFHFLLTFLYFYLVLPINMYAILIHTIRVQVMQSSRWVPLFRRNMLCFKRFISAICTAYETCHLPTRLHVMKQQIKILVLIFIMLCVIIVMVIYAWSSRPSIIILKVKYDCWTCTTGRYEFFYSHVIKFCAQIKLWLMTP